MSVGVEVDALALMLDGVNDDGWRFNEVNIKSLERDSVYGGQVPLLERTVAQSQWAEIADAILELEAWADWWHTSDNDDRPFLSGYKLSSLAAKAHRHASRYASDEILLEAAALLRDGWRPGGGS